MVAKTEYQTEIMIPDDCTGKQAALCTVPNTELCHHGTLKLSYDVISKNTKKKKKKKKTL